MDIADRDNLVEATVDIAPSPALTGVEIRVYPAEAARLSTTMFLLAAPFATNPSFSNSELLQIVSLDKVTGWLTVERQVQGTQAKTIQSGWKLYNIFTKADYDVLSDMIQANTASIDAKVEDKTYSHSFSNTSTVSVAHNLAKRPSVTVIDSAGDEVEGDINYVDMNNLIITFSAPFSGVVILN